MKKIHETIKNDAIYHEENENYTTEEIKTLERITGNKLVNDVHLSSKPFFIRIIGYAMIAFVLILIGFAVFF